MDKKQKVSHTHHHWYDTNIAIKIVFLGVIILLIVANILTSFQHIVKKDEIIYNQCTDACSKKHYWGLAVDDFDGDYYVNEFDRTYCIQNCNSLYLSLTK